jgi:hypothetical protein
MRPHRDDIVPPLPTGEVCKTSPVMRSMTYNRVESVVTLRGMNAIRSSTPEIEVIRDDFRRANYRAALFDFDGTLSLLRRNWQDVMIPMMVDILAETGTSETRAALSEHVEEFVMRLNGRQTIYQMMQLAEEFTKRGG